ncbi:MAG: hypothetical protein K2X98_01270 [Alphaproteobacteria bacterium]|nr:hypothetical protein [Alphaproteobacteria bacterium]
MRRFVPLSFILLSMSSTIALASKVFQKEDQPFPQEKHSFPVNSLSSSQSSLTLSSNSITSNIGDTLSATAPSSLVTSRHALPPDLMQDINQRENKDTLKRKHFQAQKIRSYNNAVGAFNIMLHDMHFDESDVPYLAKHFVKGQNALIPITTIADIFKGAETKEDIAYGILRLGMTAHNTHLVSHMRHDVTKDALDAFAGDCYYFVASWFNRCLSPLFKDLNLLPPHRHHQESFYLTSIDGRKQGLESAVSVLIMSKWALYRLKEDDHRRDAIHYNVNELNDLVTHFYKTHSTAMPGVDDILLQGALLGQCASQMTLLGKNATAEDLGLYLFYGTYVPMIQDRLQKKDTDTPFTFTDTGEALHVGDMKHLLRHIYGENYSTFQTRKVPEYHRIYTQFQGLVAEIKKDQENQLL